MRVRFSRARVVAAPLEHVFAWTLRTPVPQLFDRGFGPLPPVVAVDQEGPPDPWATPGQARVLTTGDGSTMREQLRDVDPPRAFRYRISAFTGPLRLLTRDVVGEYAFAEAGGGTQVRWTWLVAPASRPSALVLPLVGLLWQGYAARALARVDAGARRDVGVGG